MGMNLSLWGKLKPCKDCKKYDCTCPSEERAQSVNSKGDVKILRTPPPKNNQSKPAEEFKKPSSDVCHTNVTTIKDVL